MIDAKANRSANEVEVLSLFSGLSPRLWRGWPLMVLQAYVDESIDKSVLVLAGYISDPESWLAFTREWEAMLTYRGRWPFFKMSSVQFGDGDESWEKTEFLYRIIEKHVAASVCVSIDIEQLARVIDRLSLPQELKNPYWFGSKAIINFTAQKQLAMGFKEPVNFIFDERSEQRRILDAWFGYVAGLPPATVALTGSQPIFRDEQKFLPLQAADLLAWWCRRWWHEYGFDYGSKLDFPWQPKADMQRLFVSFTEDDLYAEFLKVRRVMDGLPAQA